MKTIYLLLVIAGAVLPYAFLSQHFLTEGVSIGALAGVLFRNPASGGFTMDLLFASIVFWVFHFHQRIQGKGPHPVPYIVLNLLIGLSCALPAYLYSTAPTQSPLSESQGRHV